MSVRVAESQKYAVHITDDEKGSDGRSHHACRVPVLFNPLQFLNHPQFLEGDRTPCIVQDSNRKHSNVESVKPLFMRRSPDLN